MFIFLVSICLNWCLFTFLSFFCVGFKTASNHLVEANDDLSRLYPMSPLVFPCVPHFSCVLHVPGLTLCGRVCVLVLSCCSPGPCLPAHLLSISSSAHHTSDYNQLSKLFSHSVSDHWLTVGSCWSVMCLGLPYYGHNRTIWPTWTKQTHTHTGCPSLGLILGSEFAWMVAFYR